MTKGERHPWVRGTKGALRRGQPEIISDILRSAANGIGRTQMMYRTMINYVQVRRYSALLLESGMLKWDPVSREFWATEKARAFLAEYDRFTKAREEAELMAARLEEFFRAEQDARTPRHAVVDGEG